MTKSLHLKPLILAMGLVLSTGAFAAPSVSTLIGQPWDWIIGIVDSPHAVKSGEGVHRRGRRAWAEATSRSMKVWATPWKVGGSNSRATSPGFMSSVTRSSSPSTSWR